jgi:hypothetical protein
MLPVVVSPDVDALGIELAGGVLAAGACTAPPPWACVIVPVVPIGVPACDCWPAPVAGFGVVAVGGVPWADATPATANRPAAAMVLSARVKEVVVMNVSGGCRAVAQQGSTVAPQAGGHCQRLARPRGVVLLHGRMSVRFLKAAEVAGGSPDFSLSMS